MRMRDADLSGDLSNETLGNPGAGVPHLYRIRVRAVAARCQPVYGAPAAELRLPHSLLRVLHLDRRAQALALQRIPDAPAY